MTAATYAALAMAAALPIPYPGPVPVPDSVRITSSDGEGYNINEEGGEGVVSENQPDSVVSIAGSLLSDSSETFDSGSASGFSSSECSYDCSGFGEENGSAWDN